MLTRSKRRNQKQMTLPKKNTREKTTTKKSRSIAIQVSSQETTDTRNISKDDELKEQLEKVYRNITAAPSYSAKITKFLRQNDIHGVYRRISKKKFPRRKVISRFPFEVCMADLIEYPQYKHVNNGYCFILILIDCFTKMLYAAPMKKKNKEWTADAFESIFKNSPSKPNLKKNLFDANFKSILDLFYASLYLI